MTKAGRRVKHGAPRHPVTKVIGHDETGNDLVHVSQVLDVPLKKWARSLAADHSLRGTADEWLKNKGATP